MTEDLLHWLQSFLQDRTAALIFDGKTTDPYPVQAGVPQGSPLSPVLFLLFVSTLYEKLQMNGLLTIGFADDTNLLAFGQTRRRCVQTLEEAFQIASEWAQIRGMEFEPAKSTLIHFDRGPGDSTPAILNGVQIKPAKSSRFLGIWIDRKLTFAAHIRAVKGKLETQMHALTRLAASTWGCSLIRSREIYTKVIRSALAYGTGVFHNPEQPTVAKKLETNQNQALRRVLGAYRATPVRQLELEAYCPPLDIYFNKRLADFENRLTTSGMAALIRSSCASIAASLRNRRGRPRKIVKLPGCQGWQSWASEWVSKHTVKEKPTDQTPERAAQHQWQQRWTATNTQTGNNVAASVPLPKAFSGSHLQLHAGLTKAQSSALIQARTGKIGLRYFLFHRQVPTIATPICPCSRGAHTVDHLFTSCNDPRSNRLREFDLATPAAVREGLCSLKTGQPQAMAAALLRSGWLTEFRVAEALRIAEALEDAGIGWMNKPPPQRAKRRAPRARRPAL